jgi:hypothetical protein
MLLCPYLASASDNYYYNGNDYNNNNDDANANAANGDDAAAAANGDDAAAAQGDDANRNDDYQVQQRNYNDDRAYQLDDIGFGGVSIMPVSCVN